MPILETQSNGHHAGGWAGRWAAGAAIMLVLVYFAWTATQGRWHTNSSGNDLRLLELQVEAYQQGRLAISTGMLDAVQFQGRYYTYFGPVPMMGIMWPWFALTGHHLPGDVLACLLASLAFLFQAATLRLWGRHGGARSTLMQLAAIVVIGGASLLTPMLRSHGTFDIPILSGLCFGSVALYFLLGFCTGGSRPLVRLAVASLALGLAIGSRASLLPCAAALVLAVALTKSASGNRTMRWFCALSPLALCLSALGLYNFVRFGSPWEFGNTHTIVTVDWTQRDAFALRYVPVNLYYYLFSWPRLSPYFPFFLESQTPPFGIPQGYLGEYIDRLAGFVPAYPVALLGVSLLWGYVYRSAKLEAKGVFTLGLLAYLGGIAVPLLAFIGTSARYQAELAMPLCLAAGCALISLETQFANRLARHTMQGLALLVALWSLAFNFALSAATYGFFQSANPTAYARVAYGVNRLVSTVRPLAAPPPQVAQIKLQLPRDKIGHSEPLLVHGRPPVADFIYLYYITPEFIQIGVESMGRGGPLTDLIRIDYAQPHEIELILGAFLPPAAHPYYDAWSPDTGATLRRMLRIKFDGIIVLDAVIDYHAGREIFLWGKSPEEAAFGQQFTGKLSLSWREFSPPKDAGDWLAPVTAEPRQLAIVWPSPGPARTEPLLSIGAKNRGQLVYAKFDGTSQVQIGIMSSHDQFVETSPFPVTAGERSVLDIVASGLNRPQSLPPHLAESPTELIVNGKTQIRGMLPACEAGPTARALGRNTLLLSGITAVFSGQVQWVQSAQ